MPANDGLGSDDRQGISQVRKQSIEADEDHPVDRIEAEPLWRGSLQDNELKFSAYACALYAVCADAYKDDYPELGNLGNEWGNVRRLLLSKKSGQSKGPVVSFRLVNFALSRRKHGFESP